MSHKFNQILSVYTQSSSRVLQVILYNALLWYIIWWCFSNRVWCFNGMPRKVALASFYATAIQALLVTMGLEQYCDTLSDNMIDVFCADAFCLLV